ncbi:hypothetical protein HaLaN_14019 [Haematococcus lacustris]|uniref:Uncharacterized protein n=1 Tax=Haematococcus lacustris TaxID=44745 RepID=A0A699Z7F8_HAELA|nr:hypothetical protein HaLaN_14019 [Haematococcus lacustris]
MGSPPSTISATAADTIASAAARLPLAPCCLPPDAGLCGAAAGRGCVQPTGAPANPAGSGGACAVLHFISEDLTLFDTVQGEWV